MVDKTKEKIINAALKEFGKKGYNGATINSIVNDAGVSDSSWLRKFGTKKILFEEVLIKNNEKIMKDLDSMIINNEFDASRDFLENLIRNLVKLTENNYEYFYLSINEDSNVSEKVIEEFIIHLSEYMEENIPNKEINYPVFMMTITSFIYLLVHDKRKGRTTVNHEEVIEIFIKNIKLCMK